MGLRAAPALISIRGAHWPRPARLLPDWLRGRQPRFDFPAKGPAPRPLQPPHREGPGARGGPGGGGRGAGPPISVLASPRLRPLGLAARPPLKGAGPGTERGTCPQVAWQGQRWGAHPSGDPPPPPAPRGALRRGSRAQTPPTLGPLSLAPGGAPRGLRAPASWALPLTEASLSPLLRAPPLVPRGGLAFPACGRTKPLFPVSPDPHLVTSSPSP